MGVPNAVHPLLFFPFAPCLMTFNAQKKYFFIKLLYFHKKIGKSACKFLKICYTNI